MCVTDSFEFLLGNGIAVCIGSGEGTIKDVVVNGGGNALTGVELSADKKGLVFTKGLEFAEKSYVDKTFVTFDTYQSISGGKNFTGGLFVNGGEIKYNGSYWQLDGDLLVTGGITAFADRYSSTSIMDAIVCDEHTITVEESNGVKRLKVIGGGTSGGVDEDAVRELIESYKYLDKVATINIYNSVGSSIMSYDGTTNRTLTLSKSHVGLANVENTALSSWTGNSHISKVGTITSGTWNGTKIANAYLANNSMTIAGTTVALGGTLSASDLATAMVGEKLTKKYATAIAKTTATSYTINHSLNTQDVVVMVYDPISLEQVMVDIKITDPNNVTLSFAIAPEVNYKVVIVG